MNILVTMAGLGKRLDSNNLPKPLIDVAGKTMIQRVIDNIKIDCNYIFVVLEQHYEKYNYYKILNEMCPGCKIIRVAGTQGQACTAIMAHDYINNDEELIIINCDSYFVWDINDFVKFIKYNKPDGCILTFEDNSGSKNWSYADILNDGIVTKIEEKNPISTHALAGLFYYKSGKYFIKYAGQMINKNIKTNNEFYIAPIYNEMIFDNLKIMNYSIFKMLSMGTQEELSEFITWMKNKHLEFNLDNFITNFNSLNTNNKRALNNKIKNAIEEIKSGKPIVLVDDYERENEGDIVISAEKANINNLVFAMNKAKGLMCIPCAGYILDRLKIPQMVENNTDKNQTPFTISVDATKNISTGMSVYDRLETIKTILNIKSKPEDLSRPGHLFPLRARDKLLLERRGHTEGSIELMKLCGLEPCSIIIEIMNDDGTMAKGGDLNKFAVEHGLTILSIDEIYEAAYNTSL